MKILVLSLIILGLMVAPVFAGEIVLTTPQVILNPATKVIDYSITFTPADIQVKVNWTDASGKTIKEEYVTIYGADFNALMGATVQSVQVGQKFSDIMFKAIRNKCKNILGVTGTVN